MRNRLLYPFKALWHILFPKRCVVCGRPLQGGEEVLCLACNHELPRTGYHRFVENPVEALFRGKGPVERATAHFHYAKGTAFRTLIYRFKYRGDYRAAYHMGRIVASELQRDSYFAGIDLIMPVPLHSRRYRQRGYNQSEQFAQGISSITAIPCDTVSLNRIVDNTTQTHLSAQQRWDNVNGIFTLQHPERIHNLHILLVDDLVTTGSTITACIDAFAGHPVRISILCLAAAE